MKITLVFSMSMMLTSCTSPAIKFDDNNTLAITLNEKTIIKAPGSIAYENRVNLSNINIYQKVFVLDSGTIVTYEDADVSLGYKFSYGVNRTIGIVFPDFNYKLVRMKGNLQFYKLSNNKMQIYLIAQNMNAKGLRLIYGISETTFDAIQRAIETDESIKPISYSKDSKTIAITDKIARSYIRSNWNTKNIILDNIISKINTRKAIR